MLGNKTNNVTFRLGIYEMVVVVKKSWPKGPFHLGRSLIIHATTVCVSWDENTSHPINGWMCKESPFKEDVN